MSINITYDTPEFWNKVNSIIGWPVNHRTFNDRLNSLQGLTKTKRLKSFSKLYQLYKLINEKGGICHIVTHDGKIYDNVDILNKTNEEELIIDAISLITPVASYFIKSEVFNKLLLIDAIHIDSVAGGNIAILAITLPNRSPLPLSFGWGKTEDSLLIKVVLNNFIKVVTGKGLKIEEKITYIISDKGTGIKSALDELNLSQFHLLCLFHLAKNPDFIRVRPQILKITNALSSEEWDTQVSKIESEIYKIYNYKSKKVSAFIDDLKSINPFNRSKFDHGFLSSSVIESFNSILKAMDLDEIIKWFSFISMYQYSKIHDLFSKAMENEFLNTNLFNIERDIFYWEVHKVEHTNFYLARHIYKNTKYKIFMEEGHKITCECPFYKRTLLHCVHIHSFLDIFQNKIGIDPSSITSEIGYFYKKSSYLNLIDDIKELKISFDNVAESPNVKPPEVKNRRSIKRKRLRDWTEN